MCPVTGYICALILLYMCLSYCYICVLIPSYYICVSHRRPHTTIYVSSCRLHMRPHTTIYVSLILLYCVFLQATYTPSYYYIYVFHTAVHVSSCRLHIRPHTTTIYMSFILLYMCLLHYCTMICVLLQATYTVVTKLAARPFFTNHFCQLLLSNFSANAL